MGLTIFDLDTIVKEHLIRPIYQDVLLIGRQSVYFTPDEALQLLNAHKVPSRLERDEIKIDTSTINRRDLDREIILDSSFFYMLGAKSVKALDHSDYEGAEVIHDLTKPLPPSLHGIADFIVDGSTLDNLFNPILGIKSLNELLRPGGRILLHNMFSNHYEPYNVLPPLWYMDYFVMNKFVDCKVYIMVHMPCNISNVFCINLDILRNWTKDNYVCNFTSPFEMSTLVVAEKGIDSTSDYYPIQQHYRPESEWKHYWKNLDDILSYDKPHVCRSHFPIAYSDIKRGHLYMSQNYEALDPGEEIKAHGCIQWKNQ